MEEVDLKQKIEKLIRSKSFVLNSKGILHKKYKFESISVLNLIFGDLNYKFGGVAKIGIPHEDGNLLYDCYNISGIVSIKDECISIVEPINILKR